MRLIPLASLFLAAPLFAQTPPATPATAPNLRMTNEVRIYQMDKDAVVNISTTRLVNAAVTTGDPIFDRFLGGRMQTIPTPSLGSGFVIHSAGYIITNEHVIDQAMDVQVVFSDGRKLAAQVLATDPEHDLAVLKVIPEKSKPLNAITLGASEDLMIGEPVYAIGNPFGYSGSMTRGIVSALDRTLEFGPKKTYKGLIQTDASINPGNSGGPLLNAYGQVIGINTAIRAEAHGIGFAISVSTMRDLLPNFLNSEVLNRTQLGFTIKEKRTIQPPSKVVTELHIANVQADSTAAKAGLKNDQIVTAINDNLVNSSVDALVQLVSLKPGDSVTIRTAATRSGQREPEHTFKVQQAPPPESERLLASKMGIEGKTVTPLLAVQEKLAIANGILITKVLPDTPAAEVGLKKGDVLVQMGRYFVTNLDDAAMLLKTVKKETEVRILIVRGNAQARAVMTLK